jgi:Tfp pilus assembly protein PilN
MVQQINLYDPALRPRRERWRAVHGLWFVGATLVAAYGLAHGLDAWSARRAQQAGQLTATAAEQRQLLQANGGLGAGDALRQRAAELEHLRALDAAQRRVQGLLDAELGRHAAGYTPYFVALSHQAQPDVWITGLSIDADGDALEIAGGLTDAAALPGYLRALDQEPQFKGRRFAQLSVKALPHAPDGSGGYTAFVLASQPGNGTAAATRTGLDALMSAAGALK